MYEGTTYEELRERIGRRDHAAAVEMQDRLERKMAFVTRSLLRGMRPRQAFEWRLQEEIDSLPPLPPNPKPHEVEGIVCYVTQRVAEELVDHMRYTADTAPVYETMCA